jgi:spermidine synthase
LREAFRDDAVMPSPAHARAICAILLSMAPALALAEPQAASPSREVRPFASKFGTVYVVDEGKLRFLRFDEPDGADQTVIDLSDPDAVPLEYVRTASVVFSLVPEPRRVLMIGLGGGAFSTLVTRRFEGARVDAVEIDPVVADLAERFFRVRPGPRMKIHVEDGARFIRRTKARYDVIFLDAYGGEDYPAHLATRRFFEQVRGRLRPGGAVVANVAIEEADAEGVLIRRFADVFGACARVKEPEWGNQILLGRATGSLPSAEVMAERARDVAKTRAFPFKLAPIASRAQSCELEAPSR